MKRLNDAELARSSVVSNSRMNRQRGLSGVNSYGTDLGFEPLDFLHRRLETSGSAAWLDLCCGSGKALVEAARELESRGLSGRVMLRGVDLVPMFDARPANATDLKLESAALPCGMPQGPFDLITCVHGLHYIGDKLGLIALAVATLGPGGRFIAHLDPANLRSANDGALNRRPASFFKRYGLEYDPRRRLVQCEGPREIEFNFRYLGADDEAGPNATGQEAVNSYYEAGSDV